MTRVPVRRIRWHTLLRRKHRSRCTLTALPLDVHRNSADWLWPGEGNIVRDPQFASKGVFDFQRVAVSLGLDELPDFIIETGDYRLRPTSPSIDSGTTDGAPTTDVGGHGRPCGAGVDMGAYESGDCPPATERFKRGDANADGRLDVADPVFVLSHLFVAAAEAPSCGEAADANDSGVVELTDAVYLLNFLFTGGASPPAPFAECGQDPTVDELSCDSFPAC